MILAEVERHLLGVQTMISPFLLDKLKLNDKVGHAAAYIAFKLQIAVHLHSLSAISVRSFIKEFVIKQYTVSLGVLLWNKLLSLSYVKKCDVKRSFGANIRANKNNSTRFARRIGRAKDTSTTTAFLKLL